MTIMPLGGGPTPPPDPTAGASLSMDQLGQDTFLKLMVAQLRNQDPMNPQDSAEFLAQTAQFTSLEKLGTVADQTSQALAAQMAFGASTLAGKCVTYLDEDGATELSGTVDSVRFTPTGPVLNVGASQVLLSSVVSVSLQDPTA